MSFLTKTTDPNVVSYDETFLVESVGKTPHSHLLKITPEHPEAWKSGTEMANYLQKDPDFALFLNLSSGFLVEECGYNPIHEFTSVESLCRDFLYLYVTGESFSDRYPRSKFWNAPEDYIFQNLFAANLPPFRTPIWVGLSIQIRHPEDAREDDLFLGQQSILEDTILIRMELYQLPSNELDFHQIRGLLDLHVSKFLSDWYQMTPEEITFTYRINTNPSESCLILEGTANIDTLYGVAVRYIGPDSIRYSVSSEEELELPHSPCIPLGRLIPKLYSRTDILVYPEPIGTAKLSDDVEGEHELVDFFNTTFCLLLEKPAFGVRRKLRKENRKMDRKHRNCHMEAFVLDLPSQDTLEELPIHQIYRSLTSKVHPYCGFYLSSHQDEFLETLYKLHPETKTMPIQLLGEVMGPYGMTQLFIL